MFTHVRVGSSGMAKSKAFYDAALAPLGIPAGREVHGMLMYADDTNRFTVAPPREGAPTYANGGTIGFKAASREAVDRFHAAGLAHGGACEGAPGERQPGLYAAYLRDPDGNKICSLAMG